MSAPFYVLMFFNVFYVFYASMIMCYVFTFFLCLFLSVHAFIHSHFDVFMYSCFQMFTIVQLVSVLKFTSRPGKNSNFAKYCPDPHYIGGLGQYAVHT